MYSIRDTHKRIYNLNKIVTINFLFMFHFYLMSKINTTTKENFNVCL